MTVTILWAVIERMTTALQHLDDAITDPTQEDQA